MHILGNIRPAEVMPPVTFTFVPPSSAKADAWLQRSVIVLKGLSPAARRAWLREWIPAAQRFPIDQETTALDLSLVVATLLRWQDECSQTEAA